MLVVVSTSFTGFGATIADLSDNSTTVSDDFGQADIVEVVMTIHSDRFMDIHDDITFLELGSVKPESNGDIIDENINSSHYNNTVQVSEFNRIYRRARDGLSYR